MVTGIHEECGVFGIFSQQTGDVAAKTYMALYALQHRGQESCGIVVNDKGVFSYHKDLGLVPEVFNQSHMEKLGLGNISIGHVRYGTTGGNNRANAQPLVVRHVKGPMAIAHNGNLVNAAELREEYELKGAIFPGDHVSYQADCRTGSQWVPAALHGQVFGRLSGVHL